MKNRFIYVVAILIIAVIACEKEQFNGDQLPEDIKKIAELNMKLQNLRNSGSEHFRLSINNSITNAASKKSVRALTSDSADVIMDSTNVIMDSIIWDFNSCAEITNYKDDNGYDVTVMDYGVDGCDEWGSLIKGKITTKWKMENNGYYFENIYENYEAYGMTMNGTFSCSTEGGDDWSFLDSTGTDSDNDYEVIYTCQENLTITYEDGVSYTFVSSFKDKYTTNSYTMLEGEFEYSSSTGEEYSYRIIEPVLTDFQCQNSYLPVSGIEQWDDGTDNYEINYGDGTCDNIATITENGETYTVDFDDQFIDDGTAPADSLTNY